MATRPQAPSSLPVRGSLGLVYAFSLGIAVLTAAASAAGLLFPAAVYPTDELRRAFVPNDVVNLIVGLPILLVSMGWTRRGKLIGLLLWPGALLYLLYNYLIYILCMPWNVAYAADFTLVMASGYSLIRLVTAIEGKAIQDRLTGAIPEKLCGGVLAGLGGLFFIRVIGVLVGAITSGIPLAATELALNISDLMVSPAWIIGGILLWRRKALGYTSGLGLLFSLSMLFIGLIAVMILQPVLTTAPFDPAGVLVVAVMGLVCFIPFALFLRGAAAGRKQPST